MSQHDLDIANQGFPATRADLNLALKALGSSNSGASAPSTTYANQLWYDTANNILKIRNEDNDAWISLFTLDQTNDNIESLTMDGDINFADNAKALFGAGSDLQVYHDGSDSHVADNGTGRLLVRTNGTSINFFKDTAETMAVMNVDGAVELYHNNAKKIETTSSGVTVTGDIALGNGNGIDFSATANSSGTVTHEIFDDYEIGTYQPTVDQGINGVSYSAQVGRYTKVGRVVYFLQHIDVASNSGTSSGQFQLGGLPFTAVNTSNVWGSAWWVYTGGGYNLDTTHITWAIQGGTTRIIAYKNSGAVFTGSNISDANAGFHLAGFYFVA